MTRETMVTIHSIVCNPFQERCYLIWDESKAAAVIDCGCSCLAEQKRLSDMVERNGLRVVAHLATHAHLDHLFGAAWLQRTYGVPVTMHEAELPLAQRIRQQTESFGLPWDDWDFDIQTFSAEEANLLLPPEWKMRWIHTPGHSRGGVCYYMEEDGFLFSGDTLFCNGFGRTDLWGGDYATLMASLRRLAELPAETVVFPGHGEKTRIGNEL